MEIFKKAIYSLSGMGKTVLGGVEEVVVKGKDSKKTVPARIDTGARFCSIDERLAEELGLGPMHREKKIRSANGKSIRPVIKVDFVLKGKELNAEFTVADRGHMNYQIIIGRNVLVDGFVVDLDIK